jgi:perosamine synthetase
MAALRGRCLVSGRIPVAGPDISEREVELVTQAVREGFYAGAQEFQSRFERRFEEVIGSRHAVALPSCTSALHLALRAWGIGPGDEVIVPEITWIATVAPVLYLGATPVFADVSEETWCISPESVERNLSPRTKAIVGVDLYGGMCDWSALRAIGRAADVRLLEDAAEAIGSRTMGRSAGTLGDAGAFSFHGSKTMTTGEGGMLVTDDEELHRRVLRLRDHGRDPGDVYFENAEVGYKYRMSAVQAALGIAQLERLDALCAMKRSIFELYSKELSDLPGVRLNAEPMGTRQSHWMSTVVWDESYRIEKKEVMRRLAERGIDSRPFFNPLSSLPALAHLPTARRAHEENDVAHRIASRGVNLPSALCLEEDEVLWAACVFRNILASSQASKSGAPDSGERKPASVRRSAA